MKKKIERKPIVARIQKPRPFDLSFSKMTENTKIIVALESLKFNSGWQFLTQVFKENLEFLGEQIISKKDFDGNPLSEDQIDRLRANHEYTKELLEKPDFFLKKLKVSEEEEMDLDPYAH